VIHLTLPGILKARWPEIEHQLLLGRMVFSSNIGAIVAST
jgi:hypothetical protein